jgi:hypothetical protein
VDFTTRHCLCRTIPRGTMPWCGEGGESGGELAVGRPRLPADWLIPNHIQFHRKTWRVAQRCSWSRWATRSTCVRPLALARMSVHGRYCCRSRCEHGKCLCRAFLRKRQAILLLPAPAEAVLVSGSCLGSTAHDRELILYTPLSCPAAVGRLACRDAAGSGQWQQE